MMNVRKILDTTRSLASARVSFVKPNKLAEKMRRVSRSAIKTLASVYAFFDFDRGFPHKS